MGYICFGVIFIGLMTIGMLGAMAFDLIPKEGK